jgi:hypothetical protein
VSLVLRKAREREHWIWKTGFPIFVIFNKNENLENNEICCETNISDDIYETLMNNKNASIEAIFISVGDL